MTYNIAAGANNFKVDLKKTAETIKKINSDIIGIQEVDKLTEKTNQIYAIDEHQLDIKGIKILDGDFNDTKESNVIKQLGRYWESVIPENMDNRTWPAVNPEVGIDNIFTNKAQKWNVKTYIPNSDNSPVVDQIEWDKVSDHLPVISILELVEQ